MLDRAWNCYCRKGLTLRKSARAYREQGGLGQLDAGDGGIVEGTVANGRNLVGLVLEQGHVGYNDVARVLAGAVFQLIGIGIGNLHFSGLVGIGCDGVAQALVEEAVAHHWGDSGLGHMGEVLPHGCLLVEVGIACRHSKGGTGKGGAVEGGTRASGWLGALAAHCGERCAREGAVGNGRHGLSKVHSLEAGTAGKGLGAYGGGGIEVYTGQLVAAGEGACGHLGDECGQLHGREAAACKGPCAQALHIFKVHGCNAGMGKGIAAHLGDGAGQRECGQPGGIVAGAVGNGHNVVGEVLIGELCRHGDGALVGAAVEGLHHLHGFPSFRVGEQLVAHAVDGETAHGIVGDERWGRYQLAIGGGGANLPHVPAAVGHLAARGAHARVAQRRGRGANPVAPVAAVPAAVPQVVGINGFHVVEVISASRELAVFVGLDGVGAVGQAQAVAIGVPSQAAYHQPVAARLGD